MVLVMKAIIYSRISDDPRGKAAGVERQADECRALAVSRGVDVLEVIVDNDISATSGKRRPGFERVMELVRSGAVDTIIVWHTDRLYRLPRDLEPLIALADSRPVRFLTVTASELDLNTSSGRMVARMLAAVSAQEVEHKAERQRSASDQRAARGIPTSRPGYGYRRDGDRLTEEHAEAAIVREAAGRVLAGESLRAVARDLNARSVPSPTFRYTRVPLQPKPWDGPMLRKVLERPSLIGQRVHRGAVVGTMEGDAILDRDTFDRLTALFRDTARASKRKGPGAVHILSGIVLCGLCGSPMHRTAGWTPKPDSKTRHAVSPAYCCKACNGTRRSQEPVDHLVTEAVLRRLEREDAVDMFAPATDDRAATARAELDAIAARLANAADAFAEGDIDRQQLARITANLTTKREALEAELRRALPPALPVDAIGPRARETWERLTMDQRREIVRALVRVTVLPAGTGKRTFDPELIRFDWL